MPETTPPCPYCGRQTVRVTGATLFPHRPDIMQRQFVRCAPCDAHVACHDKTGEPMGVPADHRTRQARANLHKYYRDPIWQNAKQSGGYTEREKRYGVDKIIRTARNRVYVWLGVQMGLTQIPHVGEFSIEDCNKAKAILEKADYAEIRRIEQSRAKRAQRVRSMLREIIPHASPEQFAKIARENAPRHPILNPATDRGPYRLNVLAHRSPTNFLCIAHGETAEAVLEACRLIERSDAIIEIRLDHETKAEIIWKNEVLSPAVPVARASGQQPSQVA